jgi:hypothetical protein
MRATLRCAKCSNAARRCYPVACVAGFASGAAAFLLRCFCCDAGACSHVKFRAFTFRLSMCRSGTYMSRGRAIGLGSRLSSPLPPCLRQRWIANSHAGFSRFKLQSPRRFQGKGDQFVHDTREALAAQAFFYRRKNLMVFPCLAENQAVGMEPHA